MNDKEKRLVLRALKVAEKAMAYTTVLTTPTEVKNFLRLKLAHLEYEVFGVVWVDNQHRVLLTEDLFRGTLTQTAVYPREIVKAGLACNAAAVVLYHNHPSGVSQPSSADHTMTKTLKDVLKLVDIRILDHLVVGSSDCFSFAEHGMI